MLIPVRLLSPWLCSVVSHKSAASSNFPASSVAKMKHFSPKDWNPGCCRKLQDPADPLLSTNSWPLPWNSWVLPLLLPRSITELLSRWCPEWRAGLTWFSPDSTAVWPGGCRQHGFPSLALWQISPCSADAPSSAFQEGLYLCSRFFYLDTHCSRNGFYYPEPAKLEKLLVSFI